MYWVRWGFFFSCSDSSGFRKEKKNALALLIVWFLPFQGCNLQILDSWFSFHACGSQDKLILSSMGLPGGGAVEMRCLPFCLLQPSVIPFLHVLFFFWCGSENMPWWPCSATAAYMAVLGVQLLAFGAWEGKGGGGPLLAAPALPGGATGRGWGSHISITDLGECLLPTGTSSSLRGSCEEGETNHGI